MKIVRSSLAQTVDAVSESIFLKQPIDKYIREEVAVWIAARQGKPGAYAEMFAPTESDQVNGIRLFTGETVRPSASLRHVLGEEACRAMILLQPSSKEARAALERATAAMTQRLVGARDNGREMFCCGTCDPALWRHVAAGGLRGCEDWVDKGLRWMKKLRDGEGRWRRFPFFYSVLALSEVDAPAARAEIKYAAPVLEQHLARPAGKTKTAQRRRLVVERALERI